MATYTELHAISTEQDILKKVSVACVVKSQALIAGVTPTAEQITWANNTLNDPLARAKVLIHYVLGANKDSTAATIRAASDATLQTNVDAAADALIAGGAI